MTFCLHWDSSKSSYEYFTRNTRSEIRKLLPSTNSTCNKLLWWIDMKENRNEYKKITLWLYIIDQYSNYWFIFAIPLLVVHGGGHTLYLCNQMKILLKGTQHVFIAEKDVLFFKYVGYSENMAWCYILNILNTWILL